MSNSKFNKKTTSSSFNKLRLTSYFLDASPNQKRLTDLIDYVKKEFGYIVPSEKKLVFRAFKTLLGEKTFYVCWCGGGVSEEKGIVFSNIGIATFEALLSYPTPIAGKQAAAFMELKFGEYPFEGKLIAFMTQLPEYTKICLFGEMTSEIDRKLLKALNVQEPSIPGDILLVYEQKEVDLPVYFNEN